MKRIQGPLSGTIWYAALPHFHPLKTALWLYVCESVHMFSYIHLILIFQRSRNCEFIYFLKFICKPQINIPITFVVIHEPAQSSKTFKLSKAIIPTWGPFLLTQMKRWAEDGDGRGQCNVTWGHLALVRVEWSLNPNSGTCYWDSLRQVT